MADVAAADLSFPVLCLARDTSIRVAHSADDLSRCNALAFYGNRYFDELRVIDSTATPYVVTRARLDRDHNEVQRFVARLLNRRLTVVLSLARAGPASLAEAKDTLSSWLDRAPTFWEASRDVAEWKRLIAGAADFAALVRLFS